MRFVLLIAVIAAPAVRPLWAQEAQPEPVPGGGPTLQQLLPPAVEARGPLTAPPVRRPSPITPRTRELNPNQRPQDHGPLFRKHHEHAARAPEAQCHSCHGGLSGSPRDNCQECHAVMRPRDHTLRFRGPTHGRQAARNPRQCATCHEIDTCTECHSIRPPSHGAGFRVRHERQARLNPRACMTCHSFESTCQECHSAGIGRARQMLRRRR